MAKTPITNKPATSPKRSSEDSFADAFDDAKAGGGSFFPVGQHVARISGFELEDTEKGLSAKITYTGQEGEAEDKNIAQWYKLKTPEGDAGPGIPFLKRDLELLGHTDVKFADLGDTLDSIANEEPEVTINVKQNGQYTNAYLVGLVDS